MTNMPYISLVVLALITSNATAADATAPKVATEGSGGIIGTLLEKQVQDDLELSKEVLEKLATMKSELKAAEPGCSDDSPECRKRHEVFREKLKQLDTNAIALLSDEERQRLQQIFWQAGGPAGLIDRPDLIKLLDLDEKSQQELRTIKERLVAAKTEFLSGAGNKNRAPGSVTKQLKKLRQANQEARERSLQVLTDAQRAKYESLIGRPFNAGE